ncbi:31344_t:CDS:2 [Racocetra persica]|uniref:31344_t:CDS:1 n=1 Tax=Racocetra persica TaxID=160502 RepID=A0ACA9KAP3_9GLOM|nr:31344_t:CDS:2 [Racocetra persica]
MRDLIQDNVTTEISLIIHNDRNRDICYYNALTAPDIAAIMISRRTSTTMIGQLYIVQSSEAILVVASKKLALILVFFRMILNRMFVCLKQDNHKVALCKNILYRAYVQLQDFDNASDIFAIIKHEALTRLENIFLLSRKSLKDFPDIPIPLITSNISNNKEVLNYLIREERSYNITDLQTEL